MVLAMQLNNNIVDDDVQAQLHNHVMPRLFTLFQDNRSSSFPSIAKNACAAMAAAIELDERCAAYALDTEAVVGCTHG